MTYYKGVGGAITVWQYCAKELRILAGTELTDEHCVCVLAEMMSVPLQN